MSSSLTPSLGFLLKRAQHAFRSRVDEALKDFGLTAPQYAVLEAVGGDDGISNAELARAAHATPQTTQAILANLVKAGLITRTAHPRHGRVLQTALTSRGRSTLDLAQPRVREIEARLAEAVGASRLAAFETALTRCADTLKV